MNAQHRQGFTLIELMIATGILGIVTVSLMQTFTVNHRAYIVVDQTSESQQSIRAVAELMERDIRHAGFMVPEAASICGVDSTNEPDLLYVSDVDAIDPGNDIAAYAGAAIQGGVDNVGPGPETLNLDSVVIESGPPSRPAYDTNGDGAADSDFQIGGGAIVVDALNPARGAACGFVEDVDLAGGGIRVFITSSDLAPTAAATDLVVVPAHEYRINGINLLRDGVLLARGVEDLQAAYFFDRDGDLQVDAGEYRGVSGANYLSDGDTPQELREVRINLVVRTRKEDETFTGGLPQALENRVFGGGPPPDGFRRRVHTASIMVRNVGSRI